ncbi:DUF3048 domain-containing protein [Candidatus Peribacteria bacterium]|jgi:hypothetical protein|nr:DUF3048 domain-containing protein [Candidatus Peribacteria bacterium]MBT4474152.1 DUF3048 domain-containing protein [Candidatus Peribacteria bacterium]
MQIKSKIPWLVACVACAAYMFFVPYVPHIPKAPKIPAISTALPTTDALLISSSSHISPQIISYLPLVPSSSGKKKSVQLVASMIENHMESRPQKGLKDAIIVFELIVEGDISRFLAIFRADRLPKIIEPIRSLRPHFVSVVAPFRPLMLHAGGSAIAYEALGRNPQIQNHDAIRYDGETYERDPKKDAPHNLMITRKAIESVIEKKNLLDFDLPVFPTTYDFVSPKDYEVAKKINLSFGSPNHNVTYTYSPLRGSSYVRSIKGADKQARPKNVLVLETHIEGFGEPNTIPWTKTFGNGKLLLFSKGKVWRGTWEREKGQVFRFYDDSGNVLPLESGQIWITMVPDLGRASWE